MDLNHGDKISACPTRCTQGETISRTKEDPTLCHILIYMHGFAKQGGTSVQVYLLPRFPETISGQTWQVYSFEVKRPSELALRHSVTPVPCNWSIHLRNSKTKNCMRACTLGTVAPGAVVETGVCLQLPHTVEKSLHTAARPTELES